MTLRERLLKIFYTAVVAGLVTLFGYWIYQVNKYDPDINMRGEYEIAPIECSGEEQIMVEAGVYQEGPLVTSRVGERWEISEEVKARFDENMYHLYLFVYCDNAEHSPSYGLYARMFRYAFADLPVPQNGQKIVLRDN